MLKYLRHRPGRAEVAVYDRTTGTRYASPGHGTFMLASVAKVDILFALLLQAQRAHRKLTPYERETAARMIRYSDNEAALALYEKIGGQDGLTRALRNHGIDRTYPGAGPYWGTTRSHPADQVRVLGRLTAPKGPVKAANRKYALKLMSSVTPDQAWGVSAVGGKVALKNGWLPARIHDGLWTINSVGRVVLHGHELLVAVLSERSPTMETGVATVEQVARIAVRALTGHR